MDRGLFLSVVGFFHEYYLSMMAAPLAAPVVIGTAQVWRLREKYPRLGTSLLLAAAGGTLALQLLTARSFADNLWWLYPTIAVYGKSRAGLLMDSHRQAEQPIARPQLGPPAVSFRPVKK